MVLPRQVQHGLNRNPNAGDIFIFRGRSGSLCQILWRDAFGLSLYAKRLERGRFIWPSAKEGVVAISASAIAYLLNDWPGFTAFLSDGRACLTNNAAERQLRSVARGRKAWLFVGSDRGGDRAAMMYTLLNTAKLNAIDPLAWLTDVLAQIADIPQGLA